MKVIAIFQEKIMHYRTDFFNELSLKYKVYVLTNTSCSKSENHKFEIINLNSFNIGPFIFINNLNDVLKSIKPDVYIATFDIRLVTILNSVVFNRKKSIWWGLDDGKSKFASYVKILISKLNVPIVFYSKFNMEKFIARGLGREFCYFANNTFHVGNREKCFLNRKNNFIFVGSFDNRKRIDILIESFRDAIPFLSQDVMLDLVGDGVVYNEMNDLVLSYGIKDRVKFHGRINNSDDLLKIYSKSFASISYGQAGLSVLQSFAFGVPFITSKNAISGSESSNIIDNHNGFFVESVSDLTQLMIKLASDQNYSSTIGQNAYNYYDEFCTVQKMASDFSAVIEKVAHD